MSGRHACFLAGVAVGAGVVLAALGLLLYYFTVATYAPLYSKAMDYKEALREHERLLHVLEESGIVEEYRSLAEQLPTLEKMIEEYSMVAGNASEGLELLETFYDVTHSGWYNETMARLAELAEKPAAALLGLGASLKDLVKAMRQAQETSANMKKLASLLREVDTARLKSYMETLDKLVKAMPPSRLEESMKEAKAALKTADELLARLEPMSPGRLQSGALAVTVVGLALAALGAVAGRRCGAAGS